MGIGIVEFRQLREVGVFSYLVISCLKRHEMVLDVMRPKMAMDFGSKEVEPMLDEGACWTKMVHVKPLDMRSMNDVWRIKLLLLELNGLICVWKLIC